MEGRGERRGQKGTVIFSEFSDTVKPSPNLPAVYGITTTNHIQTYMVTLVGTAGGRQWINTLTLTPISCSHQQVSHAWRRKPLGLH